MPVGLWEIAVIGSGPQGEAIVNTFHYRAEIDEGELAGLGEQLVTQFETEVYQVLLEAVTTDYDGFLIRGVCLSGPNQGQAFEKSEVGQSGQLVGPSAPLQTTAVIRRRGAGGDRNSRGRLFLSPIPASRVDVNGRYLDPTTTTQDLADVMLMELTTLENTYVPVLHELGGEPGADSTLITSTSVSPIAGVMRSRRIRFPN